MQHIIIQAEDAEEQEVAILQEFTRQIVTVMSDGKDIRKNGIERLKQIRGAKCWQSMGQVQKMTEKKKKLVT